MAHHHAFTKRLTILSRAAVANRSPSFAQAQSHITRACDFSPLQRGTKPGSTRSLANTLISEAFYSPQSSFLSNNRHERSRETVNIRRSSGLKAIRVIVKAWPAKGCPIVFQVEVSYRRTTACSALVDLHEVASILPSCEDATENSCHYGK